MLARQVLSGEAHAEVGVGVDGPGLAQGKAVRAADVHAVERAGDRVEACRVDDHVVGALAVVAETCDRVLVMYGGKIQEVAPVIELFEDPLHPYTQALLSAIPRPDPRVRRIMDLKCPSSGESERNRWSNLALLNARDEIKFVIGSHEDYAAIDILESILTTQPTGRLYKALVESKKASSASASTARAWL